MDDWGDIAGTPRSRWLRGALRALFGLLGGGLGLAGAWQMLAPGSPFAGLPLQLAGALPFAALAAWSFGNVLLARRWRWPGLLLLASLPLLLLVRLVAGP